MAFGLFALFWLGDALLDALFFHEGTLSQELFIQ